MTDPEVARVAGRVPEGGRRDARNASALTQVRTGGADRPIRALPGVVEERGLARKTVIARERTARLFFAEHSGRELHDLDAGGVNRFVTRQCRRLSVRSAERLVNGMRSFLRSALVEGLITAPLASGAVRGAMERRWPTAGPCPRPGGGTVGEL